MQINPSVSTVYKSKLKSNVTVSSVVSQAEINKTGRGGAGLGAESETLNRKQKGCFQV